MNQRYPSTLLEHAVNELASLPGIGRKTALRLALYMLRRDPSYTERFSAALLTLRREVKYCKVCHNLCDEEICSICANPTRDHSLVCVVENIKEVMAIENTGQFRGVYHVLHGVISPLNHVTQDDIRIKELLKRVSEGEVREVIMATNPDTEGEATAMYISRLLRPMEVKVTRLAYGVPVGSQLEYADEVTLSRALEGRQEM